MVHATLFLSLYTSLGTPHAALSAACYHTHLHTEMGALCVSLCTSHTSLIMDHTHSHHTAHTILPATFLSSSQHLCNMTSHVPWLHCTSFHTPLFTHLSQTLTAPLSFLPLISLHFAMFRILTGRTLPGAPTPPPHHRSVPLGHEPPAYRSLPGHTRAVLSYYRFSLSLMDVYRSLAGLTPLTKFLTPPHCSSLSATFWPDVSLSCRLLYLTHLTLLQADTTSHSLYSHRGREVRLTHTHLGGGADHHTPHHIPSGAPVEPQVEGCPSVGTYLTTLPHCYPASGA